MSDRPQVTIEHKNVEQEKYCDLEAMEDMNPIALPKKVRDAVWASVLKGETCPYEDERGMFVPVQREDNVPWEKFRLDGEKFKALMEGTLNAISKDVKDKLKPKKKKKVK